MAEFIDIADFGGTTTNVDVEDLPDHIAQNIENLRIRNGKLEKTFGAGQPSTVPNFALSQLNTKLSKSYVIYNLFTFISDKFATQEHRYVLVLIDSSTKEVLLFWYDPSLPAITDHLQIEDNILFFNTGTDSGLSQSDNVMVVDVKDNSGTAIADTDDYETIDVKDGNRHYVNTNSAKTWGGSFFATSTATNISVVATGGKHQTHLLVDGSVGSNITVDEVALSALHGGVLCFASYNSRTRINYTVSGATSEISETRYNARKAETSVYVASMHSFNNAIYVHFSGQEAGGGGDSYNDIVKYSLRSGGVEIDESIVDEEFTDSVHVQKSYMYEAGDGNLYLLIHGFGLRKITTGDVVSTVTIPTNSSGMSWVGITSITNTVSGSKEYLFLGETDSSNHKMYYKDILADPDPGFSSAYTFEGDLNTQIAGDLKLLSKMDFGENSNQNESLIKNYTNSGDTYVKYSTHTGAGVINAFADLDPTDLIIRPGRDTITFMKHAYRNPKGEKFLMLGTDDDPGGSYPNIDHGKLYQVKANKSFGLMSSITGQKGWNPTCFDDVATGFSSGNYFFKHAKAYIGAWGTSSVDSGDGASGDLYRFTDIGWGSGTYSASGSCDYKWTNLNDKYTIGTHYHKAQRNPIIPFSDSIRVLPGDISLVGVNSANGVWLGYIDRKLMNEGVTISPSFYAYSNVLTNPFSISDEMSFVETQDELRDSDEVRYNVTAVFDGVQETLIEESKEQVAVSIAGSGASSTSGEVVEISKSKIAITVDIDFSSLNKRITGLNIYRANRYNGVWETYKKIQEFNFITEVDAEVTTDKFMEMHYYTDKTVFVYDANGYFTSSKISAIHGGHSYYALKVGGNWKRAFDGISAITKIQGFPLSEAELNSAITDSATTGVSVTDATKLSDGDYYLGPEVHSSLGATALNAEKVTVSGIDTSANTVTLARAQGGTTAMAHPQYTEFREAGATDTGWLKIKVTKKFTATRWNSSWSVYKLVGASWEREAGSPSSVHSSGAYGSHKAGVIVPSVSPDGTDSGIDWSTWRDSSSHNITTTGLAQKYIETDDNGVFKLSDVNSYNEHAGFFHFKANRNLPAGNGSDDAKLGGTVSIKNTSTNNYTIKVTDDGLTSLGEHWGEAVVSTRVNGRYAKMIKSRLFLGNIHLDIGDENEERNDWVSYSEINQFDTRPVSNVIQFDDREGGAITGLAEIFGRLVVFKPQAIFILNMTDPVNPTSWSIVESKHSIGNIAPEGVVEVHDSIYFVYHDGIYRISSNMVASSTATPTVMDKVTDPIDDQFMLATDKTAIKGIFDSERQEIIYTWMVSSTQVVWAYNYDKQTWRKIDMGTGILDLMAYDENGSPMDYDKTSNKIIKFDTANASTTKWKSKRFALDLNRKRLIRYGTVQFVGTDTLTYNLYLDGAGSASFTKSITADGGTIRFPIKRYAKKFEIELSTASSTNAFTLERLQVEME